MGDIKDFDASKIDHKRWRLELNMVFKKSDRKNIHRFDNADIEGFIDLIIEAIPMVFTRSMVFPDAGEIKSVKSKIEALILSADAVRELLPTSPILAECAIWASEEMLHVDQEGNYIDFKAIHDYARRVWLYLDDSHKKARTPNRNNTAALKICQTVCLAYEKQLKESPACKHSDFRKQSGDIMDCTYYERVCHMISGLIDFPISWSTMRQAKENYKKISFKSTVDSEEQFTVFDKLPFERKEPY